MNPRDGEVWLVDMGMAAKTRPTVVLMADNLNAPRSLIIHIPMHQARHERISPSCGSRSVAAPHHDD